MAQKRIADRRVYGLDHRGRTVLVAAPGQPLPDGFERQPTRAAAQHTIADEVHRHDLSSLNRAQLDDYARLAGVENPGGLPNKQAVIDAIRAAGQPVLVRSFTGVAPPPRYDDEPFVAVRVEEAAVREGPWAPLETVALDPVDDDPAEPAERDLTTAAATLERAWYRLVWIDAADAESPSDPVYFPAPGEVNYRPSVAEVGALVRARTKDTNGSEVGTFTADTRPTAAQVERLIDTAVADVAMRVGPVPTDLEHSAHMVCAVRAAMLVELSYFPEQAQEGLTAYQSLRLTFEEQITRLVTAAQLRDLFAETVPR